MEDFGPTRRWVWFGDPQGGLGAPVVPDALLQEDGFFLLQENGDKILLET